MFAPSGLGEPPGVRRKKLIATMHHLLFDTNRDTASIFFVRIKCNVWQIKYLSQICKVETKPCCYFSSMIMHPTVSKERQPEFEFPARRHVDHFPAKSLLIAGKEWIPCQHIEQEKQTRFSEKSPNHELFIFLKKSPIQDTFYFLS